MKRFFLLLAVSLCVFATTQAKQINVTTALGKAKQFSASTLNKNKDVEKVMELVYTESTGDTDNFYIFNIGKEDGFVIISADDCAESILGYSDEGSIDPENIPTNMKYMLDEYKREINYAIEHNLTTTAATATDTKKAIAPIAKTKWNQGSPYNDLCPIYDTTNGYKSATGCTATAMAQVMKCYEWPTQGTGTRTYTPEKIKKSLTVDFSKTTYDWDYMSNKYTSESSSIETSAVATLMYHCGVGAKMNYGESSGASFNNAYQALINYFKYDKSMKYTHRRYYSVSEWNDLVYNELKNKRPVLYAGYNDEAGHAYVCDGYSKDNFFHINWGWGGMADGYFRLSALDPDSQGIGGSNAGYNSNQEIIYNIKKDEGTANHNTAVGITSGFKIDKTSMTSSSNVTFSWSAGYTTYYYLSSLESSTVEFGVIAENTATNERKYIASATKRNVESGYYYYNSFIIKGADLKTLAAGTYKVYPAFNDETTGVSDVILVPYGNAKYVEMTISGSTIKFNTPTVEIGSASLISLEPCTSMYAGKTFDSVAKFKCEGGDFMGSVTPIIQDGEGNIKYTGDSYNIDMEDGEEMTKHIGFTAPNIAPGTYFYSLQDEDGNMMGDDWTELTVKAAPANTTASATGLSFPDNKNVDPDNMELTATIKCTAGYFDDDMYAFIFPDGSSYSSDYIGPIKALLEAGQSKVVTFTGSVNLEPGTKAKVGIRNYTKGTWLSTMLSFTIGDYSGIQSVENNAEVSVYPNPTADFVNITTPEAISAVEVYSLAGNLVAKQAVDGANNTSIDATNLAAGVYMVKITTEQETYVKRIVKK